MVIAIVFIVIACTYVVVATVGYFCSKRVRTYPDHEMTITRSMFTK